MGPAVTGADHATAATTAAPVVGDDGDAGERPDPAPGRRVSPEGLVLPALLVGLLVLFSLLPATSDTFPTAANLKVVLGDAAVLLLVALAILVPIVCGVWDFTPGAVAGMAAVFGASVSAGSAGVVGAIAVAIGIGLAIGAVTGALVTRTRVNSVIATLGMTIVISGIIDWKTGGESIVAGIPRFILDAGSASVAGIPATMVVALVFTLVVHVTLEHTPFGRYLHALGSNRSAARLTGLPVGRLVATAFVISGALAAIAGLLLLARSGAGNPTIGPDLTLPAFAAVFLGSTSVRPGQWTVPGVLVAVAFLASLDSGLTLAGASPYVNSFANGFALLGGVIAANLLAHRRGRVAEISEPARA